MDDWKPAASAPKGVEVKVKHERAAASEGATGVLRDDKWVCSQGFIDPTTMIVHMEPTHWALLHHPVDW